MARSEDPVLILSVFGSYLVLKSSIDKCKLGLHVISARRHERPRGLSRRICKNCKRVVVEGILQKKPDLTTNANKNRSFFCQTFFVSKRFHFFVVFLFVLWPSLQIP